jgi:iron complex transport system substrate-binding protein
MRICSLLPSVTEILFEVGLGDCVVGVTHECDWPPEARSKPPVTSSRIETQNCTSAEIDAQVRLDPASLYDLDIHRLESLAPDLILTQSLCPVCAVDESLVRRVAGSLPSHPLVRAYHPTCVADVFQVIRDVGETTGTRAAADRLVRRFETEIERVRAGVAGRGRLKRIICLEWTDPPFACGHWTPELVGIAGGAELLGRAGKSSRAATWQEVADSNAELLLVAPCGMELGRTIAEIMEVARHRSWGSLAAVQNDRVFGCDGSAYFNRPGPRLIETLHILAEVIHPELFGGMAPPRSFQHVRGVDRKVG